jgi:hypothetical protein
MRRIVPESEKAGDGKYRYALRWEGGTIEFEDRFEFEEFYAACRRLLSNEELNRSMLALAEANREAMSR